MHFYVVARIDSNSSYMRSNLTVNNYLKRGKKD